MSHEASAAARRPPAPDAGPAPPARAADPAPETAPSGPDASPAADPAALTRRQMLRRLGWSGLALLAATFIPGAIRFLRPGGVEGGETRLDVGSVRDFRVPEVRTRWAARHGLWLVQQDGRLFALESRCTHLGCTPRWLADQRIFHCPCHGSRFSPDGIVQRGPATEPLVRFAIRLEGDRVVVDRTLRAKLERAERDPRFFITV